GQPGQRDRPCAMVPTTGHRCHRIGSEDSTLDLTQQGCHPSRRGITARQDVNVAILLDEMSPCTPDRTHHRPGRTVDDYFRTDSPLTQEPGDLLALSIRRKALLAEAISKQTAKQGLAA